LRLYFVIREKNEDEAEKAGTKMSREGERGAAKLMHLRSATAGSAGAEGAFCCAGELCPNHHELRAGAGKLSSWADLGVFPSIPGNTQLFWYIFM
jgi:hypothetical protein